jgi:hypothetical protein
MNEPRDTPTFRSSQGIINARHSMPISYFTTPFQKLRSRENTICIYLLPTASLLRNFGDNTAPGPRGILPQRTRSRCQIRNLRLGIFTAYITTTTQMNSHVPSPCLSHFFEPSGLRQANEYRPIPRARHGLLNCSSIARLLSNGTRHLLWVVILASGWPRVSRGSLTFNYSFVDGTCLT